MLHLLWVIFSYILGSLLFCYLISRREGKDILKIGWRKTSGSNVFRNVGKWREALTEKGRVKFHGVRFGKTLVGVLSQEIERERKGKKIKMAIAYGDNLSQAQRLKNEAEKQEGIDLLFVSQVSSAAGAYTGPEVLIAGYYPDQDD